MNDMKKAWIVRILIGGIIGMAVLFLLGGVFNDLVNGGLLSFGPHTPFQAVSYDLARSVGSDALALLVQLVLYFALGAGVGVATLPFADEGKKLLIRSASHFAYTAVVFSVLVWLCGWNWGNWLAWLIELALLALLYVLIWLGRWAAWWSELDAIREKLGLEPVPSPLMWRESLPSLGFALLLCFGLPLALHFFDAPDVPLLTAALWPYLLVPMGGFMGGLSLGKRHGVCPLYPASCALFALAVTLLMRHGGEFTNGGIALATALAGNLCGAARLRQKRRKGGRE